MYPHTESKELPIPDHVPIGAVIGKSGRNCKAIREKHRVRCFVDGDNHKVLLKGNSSSSVKDAEDELNLLFEKFAVTKPGDERVYEVVVPDGSIRLWSFEQEKHPSSDLQVRDYTYRLQQAGKAEKSSNRHKSWIQKFQEDKTKNVMTLVWKDVLPADIEVLSSVNSYFLDRAPKSSHYVTRWSNVCQRTSPTIAALLDELEKEMENKMAPQFTMLVVLTDKLGKSYGLKYHVVDGQWQFHNASVWRVVHGTYDVILDNDTSFRVRASTREKISDTDADNFHRNLIISVPDSGDFFNTEVNLSRMAPVGMFIRSAVPKTKIQLVMKGLCFSVVYLDENREEFRLECRLPVEGMLGAGSVDNECQLLLKKVLNVLSK